MKVDLFKIYLDDAERSNRFEIDCKSDQEGDSIRAEALMLNLTTQTFDIA